MNVQQHRHVVDLTAPTLRWNSKRLRCYSWTTRIIMASTAGEVECDRRMIHILIHRVVNWNCLHHRPTLPKVQILYHHPMISLRHQRFQLRVKFGKKLCPFHTGSSASHLRHAPHAVVSVAASHVSVHQSMVLCNDLANLINFYTQECIS